MSKHIHIKESDYIKLVEFTTKYSGFTNDIGNELLKLAVDKYNIKPFQVHTSINIHEKFKSFTIEDDTYNQIKAICDKNHYKIVSIVNVFLKEGMKLYLEKIKNKE
jgi:hypothetical protein